MGFLLKTAFWLTIVVLLLPAPESDINRATRMVGTTEAISVLSAALNDARGFCTRNPEACVTGTAAVQTFGYKAQYATRILNDFLTEKLGEGAQDNARKAINPAADEAKRAVEGASIGGTSTLTPSDLAPVWRAPEARQASFKRS